MRKPPALAVIPRAGHRPHLRQADPLPPADPARKPVTMITEVRAQAVHPARITTTMTGAGAGPHHQAQALAPGPERRRNVRRKIGRSGRHQRPPRWQRHVRR